MGAAQLAVSQTGTLVYLPGELPSNERPIDWLTRDGTTAVLRAAKADWANPRFSPDGQKLAVDISDGTQRDLWVYGWARDTLTQLTFDPGDDRFPAWTPDGRRIAFASDRGGDNEIWIMNADGSDQRLLMGWDNWTPYNDWRPVWVKYLDPPPSPGG